ncbi:DNA-directed DNA polymerase delta [Lithohypha guttulata]|uniref:DNA polymerase n=1 Tax=Lithohypha guttulata TaxID=1690604 RepID=A0AAN7YAF0_9EURO|nr:DNA-directed DNA polymerase delta [Lithohypha guttulata]KAK5103946.1 DNA-directed DNA polymerase delta [Lithohypha guttulata]
MPGRVVSSQKRALTDSNNTNVLKSPQSSKKRKLNDDVLNGSFGSSQAGPKTSFGKNLESSQPSHFETEVLEKLSQDISGLKKNNAERDQQWERPPLVGFEPKKEILRFQSIDIEEGTLHGGKVTLKMFGISETGNSILLHVSGFLHYLYVAAPINFQRQDIDGYKAYLETQLAQHEQAISSVQMVLRENIYGFQGNQKSPYLKITVTNPKYINRLRTTIEHGNANYKGLWKGVDGGILTFDNIQYTLRFMIDTSVTGMCWVEVPAGKYDLVPQYDRQSNCQIEAHCHYRDLVALGHDGEWAKMAPLRILSFDIECAGRKGVFPEPNTDPVIQIANVVNIYGEDKPFIRNVFVLDTCSNIVNTKVYEHTSEEKLLMAWREFLEKVDPDVIIGYNISNFDFPYLLDRAKHLKLTKFPYWSRLNSVASTATATSFSSKQMGNRDSKATNTNGRIQLDLLQLIQRDYHLRSYTLNAVCSHFLNEQKEDVHHSMITELQNANPDTRRRLAVYCLKDAYLPLRLLDKLMALVNYTEMARVTGVPFNFLLSRGQQIKFISQLFRKALEKNLVVPNLKNDSPDEAYEGATVIEPSRGYYDVPIATLDFASLYPSIIQAHNLCYTTLLNKNTIEKLKLKKDEDYIVTPNGDLFCTSNVRKGLLTEILEELLGSRKRAKKEMAVETDPFRKAVLNGRQLALKISANSVYGLTGATTGKLPCLAIASSTTSYGRQMIEKTKAEVEAKYKIANGYTHDAEVIYGDTDSVMVKFGEKDLKKVMKLGEEAANYVSSKFTNPIKLEFEKVYYPYLLINKKRYAGLYWTNPDKFDKMDTKGIETVRRDNCRLVQIVIETVLRKILIDRNVNGALAYVKRMISQLLQNKVDLSMLVITKQYTKHEYDSKQAHVELAKRMEKRGGSAAALGDRIAYVMTKGRGDSKNYEKSEDPVYVLENNIPIDTKYYLDNQLANPLGRIFEPILGEKKANSLLAGAHTRTVVVAAPTMGGLMKFTKKTMTCMGCKKPLVGKHEANGAVCENCKPRTVEMYSKTVRKAGEAEVRFGRLWTQCQRCQGSVHTEVLCQSRDCPIFYMRMKARKDVEHSHKELARFDDDGGANW